MNFIILGKSPGAIDIRDFVKVGVTNHAVVLGLALLEGHTYYATIRGKLKVFCKNFR